MYVVNCESLGFRGISQFVSEGEELVDVYNKVRGDYDVVAVKELEPGKHVIIDVDDGTESLVTGVREVGSSNVNRVA